MCLTPFGLDMQCVSLMFVWSNMSIRVIIICVFLLFVEALGTTWNKYYVEYYKHGKKLKMTSYTPTKPVSVKSVFFHIELCHTKMSSKCSESLSYLKKDAHSISFDYGFALMIKLVEIYCLLYRQSEICLDSVWQCLCCEWNVT